MPDLDLIKQEEQGQALGPACERTINLCVRKIFCFPPEEKKRDTALKCPNDSEH
jgi:hypothetical protein